MPLAIQAISANVTPPAKAQITKAEAENKTSLVKSLNFPYTSRMQDHAIIIAAAFFIEAFCGYPQWLYQRIRHPVVWMGWLISALERRLNTPEYSEIRKKYSGILTLLLLLTACLGAALLVEKIGGAVATTIAIATLLASRSLYDHVRDVARALQTQDLAQARLCVGRIVGRDVSALDEAGICRAAIESLAESFSDGVVAPLFWAACFGLPGIACYKAINTADSMIGHKDARYRAFGWAAARADDVANWIPARLAGLLIALAACSASACRIMWRDARSHASPNAGWPEAAMAGALGLQLGGINFYDGVAHATALLGEGRNAPTLAHLQKALRLYLRACALLILWVSLALAMHR